MSALHGHLDCARLLCDAGANVNAACNQGATPFFASCQEGHLGVAKLLSSHGAARNGTGPFAVAAGSAHVESTVECLADKFAHTELLEWLRLSRGWLPLHHVDVLAQERARELLRADVGELSTRLPHQRARHGSSLQATCLPSGRVTCGRLTPEELARDQPGLPAAQLILRAAAPWSPDTHQLWDAWHRRRAVALCKLGYLLAYRLEREQHSFGDAWVRHVMPRAMG